MVVKLEAKGVVKTFRQGQKVITALDTVDFKVNEGEFVAVMGASGSGKSTLLHAMAGLLTVDDGQMIINQQPLEQLNDRQLTRFRRDHIGLVFQAYNLIPVLTARENILLPVLGKDKAREADRILQLLDLSERGSHRPDALSGGEQQRVAIARALITNPAIILLDEPTGNLDSVAGHQVCQLLRRLCDEEKRTIIVVTHEPSVAFHADRLIVLKDGQIIDDFATKTCANVMALTAHYQQAITGKTELAWCK